MNTAGASNNSKGRSGLLPRRLLPRLPLTWRKKRKVRGLQHKLTRSYLAVTLCAVVIVELLLGVLIWLLATRTLPAPPQLALQTRERAGKLNASLLRPGSAPALQAQLALLRRDNRLSLAVSDSGGRVLASVPEEFALRSTVLPNRNLASLGPAFEAARRGEALPSRLSAPDAEGGSLALAPIEAANGRVVGWLWARTVPPPRLGDFSRAVIATILVSAVVVGLFTGGVGLCFGWMNARRLAQRLRVIADAADSWSRGEFGTVAHDDSDDEIGQLARRLNLMAFQLQELVALRQNLATSEERNRLSRELHDTVKQKLFATNMQIGAARALLGRESSNAQARLNDAERLGSEAQQELTAILAQLRPGSYLTRSQAQVEAQDEARPSEIRLEDALRDYLREWCGGSSHTIQAELRAEPTASLNGSVQRALFRVAQEALANVARHSQATRVLVLLHAQGEDVVLCVTDDGRGFDASSVGNGLGLHTMRERTEALPGGRFSVASQEGGGTRIEARTLAASQSTSEPSAQPWAQEVACG